MTVLGIGAGVAQFPFRLRMRHLGSFAEGRTPVPSDTGAPGLGLFPVSQHLPHPF